MTKRRELLKVLSVAGATGAVWKKPVVDAVMLPAHAQTSCGITGIEVVFSVENTGTSGNNWGFGGGFSLWDDQDNIYFNDGAANFPGPNPQTETIPDLPPGEYYFNGNGGGNGDSGTNLVGSFTVSCCNDSMSDSDSGPGISLSLIGTIVIAEDGSCTATEGDVPQFPGGG